MRGLAEHLSDLEASFFHDTEPFALPPLETWEDLEDDYEPQGFWARAFGSRPRVQTPIPVPITVPLEPDDEEEWEWQLALARARAATEG